MIPTLSFAIAEEAYIDLNFPDTLLHTFCMEMIPKFSEMQS